MFPGQQSIQCTGMKSGPMSPINEKKAPHPRPGQGQDGQRNIYYGDGASLAERSQKEERI